jgi:EAL domain-containing protein (putative c-di-GMP-specific phosphodiesterase class I)
VVYQPLVDLAAREIIGAEALLRWHHPEHGVVSPADFVPLAESTGLIESIGAWVLCEACHQAASWNAERARAGEPPLKVSVNLSARQLLEPSLLRAVREALTDARLEPGLLTLEITETALIESLGGASERLDQLRRLGVDLALDDFGTGYSSLSYLRRLPISLIKVDRAFVGGLGVSAEDEAIVSAVVSLAGRTDRIVLAEGVETEEQAAQALRLGCAQGQGWLFGRPMDGALLLSSAAGLPRRSSTPRPARTP